MFHRNSVTVASQRYVIPLVFVLLGTILLGACGKQDDGKIHLTYGLWDPVEQVAYQKSIDVFEKNHPNIKIDIQQTPYDQYWPKISTQLAGGAAPDLFWQDINYFPQYAQQGQLMDIGPLLQKDNIDTSIYYPALLSAYTYQGKQYGLPKDWDTIALFYNKDIFKKMGITPDNDLTWNPTDGGTYLKMCQQLTVDKNGRHPTDAGFDSGSINQFGCISANDNQSGYWNYIAMNGGKFLDKQYGNKFLFNQPESVQALQFLVDMSVKYHVSPSASETNNVDYTTLFASGKTATVEMGSWQVAAFAQSVNFPFGVLHLPTGPKGRISVFNGLADSINVHTKHQAEAWEFFKWLASSESESIVSGQGVVWPGIKNLTPLFTQYWSDHNVDVTPFLDEANGQTVSAPITTGFNEANSKITDEFNLMYLGQESVQDATNKAVRDANAALQSGN
jgi:multiple sugar transport system substrate-binding protein